MDGAQGNRGCRGWQLIWQLAGILAIDPGPLTLRELVWMAEARLQSEWGHTASLMALIANAHRDPKKHGPFKPSDFDPTHPTRKGSKEPVVEKADISVLKDIFIPRNHPGPPGTTPGTRTLRNHPPAQSHGGDQS